MSIFTDKTVYNCPKENCTEKETACYDALEKLGISFDRVSHEHIGTIEGCIEIAEVLGASIHKNLFLCNAQKTDFYLVIMPGEKPFKTKFFRKSCYSSLASALLHSRFGLGFGTNLR